MTDTGLNFCTTKPLPDDLRHRAPSSYFSPAKHRSCPARARSHESVERTGSASTLYGALAPDQEAARQAALKRKVRTYQALQKGMYAGMSDDALDQGSIDWAAKMDREEDEQKSRSGSEADAGSNSEGEGSKKRSRQASPPRRGHRSETRAYFDQGDDSDRFQDQEAEDPDEPTITYLDEFGRTRVQKQSQVPRHVLAVVAQRLTPSHPDETRPEEIHYGPATAFPVYQPTAQEFAVRQENKRRAWQPVQQEHFDSKTEIRNRAAGFYQFSHDPAEREAEMQALAQERKRTEQERKQRGKEGFESFVPTPWPNHKAETTNRHDGKGKQSNQDQEQEVDQADHDPFARVEKLQSSRLTQTAPSQQQKLAARRAQIAARRAELAPSSAATPHASAGQIGAQLAADKEDTMRLDAQVDAFLSDVLDHPRPTT